MDRKTPPNQSSPPRVQVKKENEEEIKEFAETAMNELLGWYGYERLELRRWAASRARDASSPEQTSEQRNKDECSWCNKPITSESGGLQQAGAAFCSELCFSQSRRANFKRAKTCDWCRHVRHTVAYVDFQDGATQLQFCSDKCLNQYKMHIFCRETQAHLDLNPHLVTAASTSNLITPDLWLKNCKSRSASPTETERSGSPEKTSQDKDKEPPKTQKSPLPLITVAPTAKLMKQKREGKSPEAKKDTRNKMNLRKRRTSKSATVTSQKRTSTPKAQDLRMCSPSEVSSPASVSTIQSPPQPNITHPPPPTFPNHFMPPSFIENHPGIPHQETRHPIGNMFPPRMPFMPRYMIPERPRLPINYPQPLSQPPPVTVLVPYPVIIPMPIPIPIPMPLSAFVKAHATRVKTETGTDDTEGPLDFTMNHRREENTPPVQIETEPAPEQPSEDNRTEIEPSDSGTVESGDHEPEQTLPKFKITRLGNKMAKIVAKPREPSESSRPLRKRRRLVEAAEDEALIPKTRKIVQV